MQPVWVGRDCGPSDPELHTASRLSPGRGRACLAPHTCARARVWPCAHHCSHSIRLKRGAQSAAQHEGPPQGCNHPRGAPPVVLLLVRPAAGQQVRQALRQPVVPAAPAHARAAVQRGRERVQRGRVLRQPGRQVLWCARARGRGGVSGSGRGVSGVRVGAGAEAPNFPMRCSRTPMTQPHVTHACAHTSAPLRCSPPTAPRPRTAAPAAPTARPRAPPFRCHPRGRCPCDVLGSCSCHCCHGRQQHA